MPKPLIKPLHQLLKTGSCKANWPGLAPLLTGSAHPEADGGHWVASRRLRELRGRLSSDAETVAAILARDPDTRAPWLAILAARCEQAGRLPDGGALLQLVTGLEGAAGWVEAGFARASLDPSTQIVLERDLLGVTLEQARATPMLVRILAAAYRADQWQADALPPLATVDADGQRPDRNWCGGRLLALPGHYQADDRFILSAGAAGDGQAGGADAPMPWVLANPWLFLLAMIVYVQDTWSAEASGGLLLELPNGQSPHQPGTVQVLVAGDDGVECLCGSLGGLVLGILSRLNMGLFPIQPDATALDGLLSPLVTALLQRRVWRYREGLSGQQGFYQIESAFADACYRIQGARSFGLYGRGLRQAIREQAEQWRLDRRQSSPEVHGGPRHGER
jgi:hypothetical protein